MTKHEKVKLHLELRGSITSWEAIQSYRATRLSDIIFKLKKELLKEGKGRYIESVNENKNGTHWTRYFLRSKGYQQQLF